MARPTAAELLGVDVSLPSSTRADPSSLPGASPSAPGGEGGVGPAKGMQGAHDAAGRYDRTMALWRPGLRSADDDILFEKGLIDARSRDTLRNDAYVANASRIHQDNIVGPAFLLNAKPDFEALGLDEEWAFAFQKEVESKFRLWAESENAWPDASRRNTFSELVRLAVSCFFAGGEVLAVAEWIREPGRPFRTAIQMVDPDRLSNPFYDVDTSETRAGVRMDRYGSPIGYHIRATHPSEWRTRDAFVWKYVEARKPWGRKQVIHLIDQTRPGQTRGVSEIVSSLKELRITKAFRDVTLQNAVVNATFAAAIESDLPSEAVFESLGAGDASAAISAYTANFMGSVDEFTGAGRSLMLDGVRIPHLHPGTKLSMHAPGKGGPLGADFEKSLLRYVAASLGVSYEQLSRDYSSTNYSSARAAMNETWKYMLSRKRFVADRFANAVYRLWIEEAINTDQIESMRGREALFYDGLMQDAICACEWIGPSRGQVDELKETQAAALRLKYNLTTQEDELARLGKDWRVVNAQRQREVEDAVARGLSVDPQDDSMNAASGSPQEREPGEEPEDTSGDDADE